MQWLYDTVSSLTGEGAAPSADADPSIRERLQPLQTSGMLSKAQLMAFFEAGEALLASEETRRKLKDAKLLDQDVEELVTTLQKDILENQGVQGDFGISCLSRVSTEYKQDSQLMARFLKFVHQEEQALDEAEMSPADYEQKQRLLELAKAHTAELMAKMDELPPEQRQEFLRNQMQIAEQLKRSAVEGGQRIEPPPNLFGEADTSMSQSEQMQFFAQMHGR